MAVPMREATSVRMRLLIGSEIIEFAAFDVQNADHATANDQRDGKFGANGIQCVEVTRVRANVADANGLAGGGSGADDAFTHGDAPVFHDFRAVTDGETEVHLIGPLFGEQDRENFVVDQALDERGGGGQTLHRD